MISAFSYLSGMKKLGARPKLVLPFVPKKPAEPAKPEVPLKPAKGEKRFRYEAWWTPHRENLRWQDMVFVGRSDLVGPDVFELNAKPNRGKLPCGTCNGLMKKDKKEQAENIYRCVECDDQWEVTVL